MITPVIGGVSARPRHQAGARGRDQDSAAFAADADRLARFQREAQLLASLNHRNIAAIYGIEDSTTVTALVLELVEGVTLAEQIAGHLGVRCVLFEMLTGQQAFGPGETVSDAIAAVLTRARMDVFPPAHPADPAYPALSLTT